MRSKGIIEGFLALGKIGSKEAVAYLNKTLSDRDSTWRICDLPWAKRGILYPFSFFKGNILSFCLTP